MTWPNLVESAAAGGGDHTDSRARKTRAMVIHRGHRFTIEFDSAFPQGLALVGDVHRTTRRAVTKPPADQCDKRSTM
jgi:hypothetical protein